MQLNYFFVTKCRFKSNMKQLRVLYADIQLQLNIINTCMINNLIIKIKITFLIIAKSILQILY